MANHKIKIADINVYDDNGIIVIDFNAITPHTGTALAATISFNPNETKAPLDDLREVLKKVTPNLSDLI